jgi:hypothetical protein
MAEHRSPEPNVLGNASLALGIVASALVFGIGLCALTAAQQGWLGIGATPLYVCGASSAFLGLLGTALGMAGLFGKNRSRASAIVGMVLGVVAICLFVAVLTRVGGSGS